LLVGGGLLLLALVGWVGVRGAFGYAELSRARRDLTALERQVRSGEVPPTAALTARVDRIGQRTRSARGLTGDPVFAAASRLPGVGCPLRSARALVVAVDGLAAGGLPSLVQAADVLNPASLRSGMSIDTTALAKGEAPVSRAAVAVARFRSALDAVPGCGWLGRTVGLTSSRHTVSAQAARLGDGLAVLRLVTQLGPPMLGADGQPRKYLLIVQNPAESRSNGGIIGGFGLLTVTNGHLDLGSISGSRQLPFLKPGSSLVTDPQLPADLRERYAPYDPTRTWGNANLTPDYPRAGQFYSGMYLGGTGVAVDGTISIDPAALSYLLAAAGRPAVLPDGRTVTASSLVRLVESDAYAIIPDPVARDQFFADVGKAVYRTVTSGASTPGILRALARSVAEGRLLVSSNHTAEESVLATTALGGALPSDPGPFLAVLTQNAAASKLDYWTHRAVGYRMQRRPDGSGIATISVTVENDAPLGLPDYVRYRLDPGGPTGNPDAQNKIWLSVYTGVGSQLLGASLDGKMATLERTVERGHPVASTYLTLDRGKPRTLALQIWEPAGGPALTVRRQPLVNPEGLLVEGLPTHSPRSLSVGN
jgi:hypothetical protein